LMCIISMEIPVIGYRLVIALKDADGVGVGMVGHDDLEYVDKVAIIDEAAVCLERKVAVLVGIVISILRQGR
jgi:hypothetical protein